MTLVVILAAVAAVLGGPALLNLLRRADVRRMAVRNAARRPVETALVVIGSALGTAIIAAALMVGDTFDTSISDIARRNLGEYDLSFEFDTSEDLTAAETAVRAALPERVDGAIALRGIEAAAVAGGPEDAIADDPDRPVEPRTRVGAVDFDSSSRFGTEPDRWALSGATDPGRGGVVINDELASDLGLEAGDRMTLFLGPTQQTFEVAQIIEAVGLGGHMSAWVSVAEWQRLGVPDDLADLRLAVSLEGTVFDPSRAEVDPAIVGVLSALGYDESTSLDGPASHDIKHELLDDAEEEGAELSTIFSVVGGFSVLAGVLLLINLFVMLSEERKPNLGVLRAIGWRRAELRRAFRAEGLLYALPASVVGSGVGIGLGWVIIRLTRDLFEQNNPGGDFELITDVETHSLVTAALIGLIIAMAAISFTSWRISRLNIVAAIRDLPNPKTRRSGVLVAMAGVASIVAGGFATISGLASGNPYIALVSVPLIVVGVALLLRSVVPVSVLTTIGGLVVLVWSVLLFQIIDSGTEVDIEFFLLYGVVTVGAGVGLATVGGGAVQRLLRRTQVMAVPGRLALAYPTSRLFRTASSLAMYSLIIFSLAFMGVMSKGIEAQADSVVDATAAGHDVLVDSLPVNPVSSTALAQVDGVASASSVIRSWPRWKATFDPETIDHPARWNATAPDAAFVEAGAPALVERAPRFATDVEAFEHVVTEGTSTVIAEWFLGGDDGFDPSIGDIVSVELDDGSFHELEVVGILGDDFAWTGAWVGPDLMHRIDPAARATRAYVATTADADPAAVADRIEARFLAHGAEAESFEDRVGRFIELDLGFFGLLRGYLLLGLIIGIGGLAVTLFRAVRERRRQIGMLRSMGLAARGVGQWFLGEAAYISIMGIACGVSLGLLSGYFVATQSNATGDDAMPFAMPWAVVAAIIAIPLVASAIAALVPARRAAALRPSEALRLAD